MSISKPAAGPVFRRHSQPSIDAYLKLEALTTLHNPKLAGTPGSITIRSTTTGKFYYRQYYDDLKKKKDQYIGPATTPDGERLASEMQLRIDNAREIRKLTKDCLSFGYRPISAEGFASLVGTEKEGKFEHGLVLTGPPALQAVINTLGLRCEKPTWDITTPEFVSIKMAHFFMKGVRHIDPEVANYISSNPVKTIVLSEIGVASVSAPRLNTFLISELFHTLKNHHSIGFGDGYRHAIRELIAISIASDERSFLADLAAAPSPIKVQLATFINVDIPD